MDAPIVPTPKAREIHNHHMDSTFWDDLVYRNDDIVVATYAKSGTTWMQQIISQLIFNGDPSVDLNRALWVDLRFPPRAEKMAMINGQTHRRSLKTHLPFDALNFSPAAKYFYIARDGRDVVWSMHNHFFHAKPEVYEALNNTPGRIGPGIERPGADVRAYFLDWLEQDGFPIWPFWENVRSWWGVRDLANVRLIHFDELKSDLPGAIRAIADFAAIDIDESRWDTIVDHCSFDYMKKNAPGIMPQMEMAFEGGAQTFINKGINGRWKTVLSAEDNHRYIAMAEKELGKDCAHWLATGEMPDRR